jgi:hypothetical protein
MTRRRTLLVWALAAASGPLPGPESASDLQRASLGDPAVAALVVGCWHLRWAPDAPSREAVESPDSVRLRDEVVFGTRERLLAPATHPLGRRSTSGEDEPWEAHFVLNRWWVQDGSLRLRFSTGEGEEWNATLGLDPERITGVATGAPGRSTVSGQRIECSF